jgi:hypothetical protein
MTEYGKTLHWDDDFSPQMHTVEAVGQALYRRLSFSPGAVFYDRSYGTNLCDFINQASDSSGYEIERAAEIECLKDDRVDDCEATAEMDGSSVVLSILVTLGNGEEFTLVLSVTNVTVEILEIKREE